MGAGHARVGGFGGVLLALVAAGCLVGPSQSLAPAMAPAPAQADCLAVVNGLDLHHTTFADLQAALAAGTVTSVQLVDAYAARIAAYDNAGPELNSVQDLMPDARAQAEALDAERAAGHVRGPLHGLPMLLKDNVGAHGLPTTAGALPLKDNVPEEEATLTTRLRDAGAVILGKAQLSEFANWVSLGMPSGYSSLGGQVVNAYTLGNPSGSSSGSGVAGSMALAAGTIGTETSGSILSPSNQNSLVGVKPTLGLVSRAGVIPLAANFDTPGPMVRHVLDAALMLDAIAGPDPRDPATAVSAEHLPEGGYAAGLGADALEGVRLGYRPNNDPLFAAALEDLEALGAELVAVEDNELALVSLTEIGLIPNEFKFGINRYLAEEAGPGLPVQDLTDIVLFAQAHPAEYQYGYNLLLASDLTPGSGPAADAAALPVIAASRAVADGLFADFDVDAIVGHNAPFTGLGAAAGYPTVVVPNGYDGDDPEGLSFFGPAWSEAHLLAYAYAFEQASQRRQPPPDINPSLLDDACPGASGAASAPAADGPPAGPVRGAPALDLGLQAALER